MSPGTFEVERLARLIDQVAKLSATVDRLNIRIETLESELRDFGRKVGELESDVQMLCRDEQGAP